MTWSSKIPHPWQVVLPHPWSVSLIFFCTNPLSESDSVMLKTWQINIESPPTTYLVADSKNRSASCGSLVAVDVEVKTHGQDDKKNAPYVVEQPYAMVTNQDRKSSKKAKSIRFNIRPSKNGRKHCHIDMDAFLTLCHIPHSNYKTQYLVQKNCLHHWSVFKLLTPVDLKSMRFSIGPALLLS
jgi:hypothetical protein